MVWYAIFPKPRTPIIMLAFNDVIWFGLTAIAARRNINTIMNEEKLPTTTINFKISVDYGKVEVAETAASGGAEDSIWFIYEPLCQD